MKGRGQLATRSWRLQAALSTQDLTQGLVESHTKLRTRARVCVCSRLRLQSSLLVLECGERLLKCLPRVPIRLEHNPGMTFVAGMRSALNPGNASLLAGLYMPNAICRQVGTTIRIK